MSQPTIRNVAAVLCAAIKEHAALCEDDPENVPMIAPLTERIHGLVRAYGDVLRETSGWSNPLLRITPSTLAPESDSVEETEIEEAVNDSDGRCSISVVDRHALFVNDPDVLISYAEERFGEEFETVVGALLALLNADGWKPDAYPGQLIETDWRSTDACTG